MKAAAFCIERPSSVADAVRRAQALGGAGRILAGGQSLLPAMSLRITCPDVLIDIGGLAELHGVSETAGEVCVGALTTYRQAQADALVARHVPLLPQAIALVAHPAIRSVGTLGGSIALADPAAEMPAVCLALGARIGVHGASGGRWVDAKQFFRGMYETALAEGELVTAISFPKAPAGSWHHVDEVARRRGDYATAGIAVCRHRGELPRIALFGVSSRAVLLPVSDARDWATNLGGVEFFGDLHSTPAMKEHLVRVLLGRAAALQQGALH